eukprot:c43992_g1_i1 orf=361-612(+)
MAIVPGVRSGVVRIHQVMVCTSYVGMRGLRPPILSMIGWQAKVFSIIFPIARVRVTSLQATSKWYQSVSLPLHQKMEAFYSEF